MAGTGEGRSVAVEVGRMAGAEVGVVPWQAVMRMRHPKRRIFFMALIKTQLPVALFQTIGIIGCHTLKSIAANSL